MSDDIVRYAEEYLSMNAVPGMEPVIRELIDEIEKLTKQVSYVNKLEGTAKEIRDTEIERCAKIIETMRQQTDDWKKIIVQKDKEIEHLLEVIDKLRDGRVV